VEKNSAQVAKIEPVEKDQKNAPKASDALWSTIAKRNVKKSTEQLKVINVKADEGKERSKKEKNIIVFGLKESTKGTLELLNFDEKITINIKKIWKK
jgi:hypothetical protein